MDPIAGKQVSVPEKGARVQKRSEMLQEREGNGVKEASLTKTVKHAIALHTVAVTAGNGQPTGLFKQQQNAMQHTHGMDPSWAAVHTNVTFS